MSRAPEVIWTPSMDRQVRSMLRVGTAKSEIARVLGVHRVQLLRRIKKFGLDADLDQALPGSGAQHLQDYRRAKRGFHLPPDLEPAYFDLLKQGVSIEEARVRLNLPKT